jgi:hypothetical protein
MVARDGWNLEYVPWVGKPHVPPVPSLHQHRFRYRTVRTLQFRKQRLTIDTIDVKGDKIGFFPRCDPDVCIGHFRPPICDYVWVGCGVQRAASDKSSDRMFAGFAPLGFASA